MQQCSHENLSLGLAVHMSQESLSSFTGTASPPTEDNTTNSTDNTPSTDRSSTDSNKGTAVHSNDPDLYHPSDEWDEMTDKSSMGIDGGRRAKLEAIKNKPKLDLLDEDTPFDSFTDLLNALRELSVVRQDGYMCLSMPQKEIETIRNIFNSLPEEAQPHFLADEELKKRVNTARRRFNEWMGRYERLQKMPGWAEAGPANYPKDKFNRLSESERSKRDELDEAIDRIRAGANGGIRQRALDKIGSSVAEQNAEQEKSEREQLKDQLESGMIVTYRNPREQVGYVIRINQKSLRVERPNPRHPGTKPLSDEPEPEYIRETPDLDPQWLTPISSADFEAHRDKLQEIDSAIPDAFEDTVDYLQDGE